jgi:hypothetical protein
VGGLTDHATGPSADPDARLEQAHRRWETTLITEIDRMRQALQRREPREVGERVAARLSDRAIELDYWGRPVRIVWPELSPRRIGGDPLSTFDQAMLLYHLDVSDGTPPGVEWVAYRELPGGAFYHQAFLGYTGRRLASAFGTDPSRFDACAAGMGGRRLDGPSPYSWGFSPLPRVPLAACLWPGDEDLPPQAAVLFDVSAAHHLPIDGLALLGAGLTGRLLASPPG